ncbi:hypothetical protein TNCT_690101 [Trichonephila clavata]|uniref:Uncharacterized protein n=1 Tax=Trichonephila clavata TaxID=2740835 RepID=A0A8X6FJN1_TRICU|nr:hypothetical protein TNCT_690101 [Trichonephila clavata]
MDWPLTEKKRFLLEGRARATASRRFVEARTPLSRRMRGSLSVIRTCRIFQVTRCEKTVNTETDWFHAPWMTRFGAVFMQSSNNDNLFDDKSNDNDTS